MINKNGLDTSCVVPQHCRPLYMCEANFKTVCPMQMFKELDFFFERERTGEGLAKDILKEKCCQNAWREIIHPVDGGIH